MPQLQDRLDRRLAVDFVGRKEELDLLLETLAPDGPLVVYLHGIAGAGKSTLLEAFTRRARTAGATVIRLDCQAIEPTEAGLLSELTLATGATLGTPDGPNPPGTPSPPGPPSPPGTPSPARAVAARLGQVGTRVVVALDTYEVFPLMDSWLRQVFVPLLPDNVRFILCGREGPVTAWLSAPGWHGLFKTLRLDSLDQGSALEFLARAGVPPEEARRLQGICHGHPLALTLAASLQDSEGASALNADVGLRIVEKLSRLYVADIADLQTRRALEAASVIRRVTVPLLAAMLPDLSPQDSQERIRGLPFVQADRHGLRIHDAVREAVALTLRAENSQQYREYRRSAYRCFMAELRTAAASDLWRCTADLLYLLENPVVREAFFPTCGQEYVLEPAQSRDGPSILEIIDHHEAPAGTGIGTGTGTGIGNDPLTRWWMHAPETFMVARDPKGMVAGFYCAFDPGRYPARLLREDPVTRPWMEHLERQPVPRQQHALFLRWLDAETGEAPSAVQAACWVDLKRKYLELRPNLRRVYLTVQDISPYAAVGQRLGFQVLREGHAQLHPQVHTPIHAQVKPPVHAQGNPPVHSPGPTLMLDFGPSSVDGWLTRLVAAELGCEDNGLLDCAARELVMQGRRVSLSKLEFGVMEYLQRHVGEAVPRIALLENVWEQSYDGGSNVVDVVILALRKKLAENASLIETVQGVGYRLCREQGVRPR